MTGFIAMQREALDHPLLQDAARFRAWFWLVAKAAWKPTQFNIRGSLVAIERGQVCASVRQLADAWGMSKSAVDRFLTRLETETMIEREAGHGRLIITICNYEKYQSINEVERDTSGTQTGTPAGHQRDTKEQGNNTLPNGRDKQSPRARKGHRLSDAWTPKPLPEPLASDVAAWPAGAIERELARFRDWAASATGPNAVKKDWDAAWRNWLRKAQDEGRHGTANRNGNSVGFADRRDGAAKALDRRLGLDCDAGAFGRRDAGGGGGSGELAIARSAQLR